MAHLSGWCVHLPASGAHQASPLRFIANQDVLRAIPCTLLGALYYEMGDFSLGDEWFAKAVERGARPRALDEELRSIYLRSSGVRREGMKRHLLAVDPIRYGWVNAPKRSGSEKSGHGKFKR
jgi:hypothetical protein